MMEMFAQNIRGVEAVSGRATLILNDKADSSKDLDTTVAATDVVSGQLSIDFGSIASRLFNLEPISEPEKVLNIELDIYQMEQDQPS
ncbi:MAG: hypothetical protein QXR17_04715 [Candidatus Bathyarchaeia archaeon]|nr:hypothetical protein [Candidatus Bathyarchaeota archaeon]